MKIKTYPLQFTEEYLNELREIAKGLNMSLKEFMLNAIDKEKKANDIVKIQKEMTKRRDITGRKEITPKQKKAIFVDPTNC